MKVKSYKLRNLITSTIIIVILFTLGFYTGKTVKKMISSENEKSVKVVFEVNKEDFSQTIGEIEMTTNAETLGDFLEEIGERDGWEIDIGSDNNKGEGRILNGVNGYETVTQEIDPWWVYTSDTAKIPEDVDEDIYKRGVNFKVDEQLIEDGDVFLFEFKLFDGEV